MSEDEGVVQVVVIVQPLRAPEEYSFLSGSVEYPPKIKDCDES